MGQTNEEKKMYSNLKIENCSKHFYVDQYEDKVTIFAIPSATIFTKIWKKKLKIKTKFWR